MKLGCSKSHLATELHAFSLHHFQVLALAGDPCLPPHLGKKTMLKEKKVQWTNAIRGDFPPS